MFCAATPLYALPELRRHYCSAYRGFLLCARDLMQWSASQEGLPAVVIANVHHVRVTNAKSNLMKINKMVLFAKGEQQMTELVCVGCIP